MKVTYPQLLKIIEETDDDNLLKETLRYIFSLKENIDIFSYFIFPDAITIKIPDFHYKIYDFLLNEKDGAMAAPRGFAKSTIAGLIFITWCIVNNREEYIVYVSSNHTKTTQFLEPIRDAFKNNSRLKSLYNINISSVKDEQGRDREDCFDILNTRVEAVSFEKNLRGFKYKFSRPTLIIGDDIESDDRVINPNLRLKDQYKLDKIIIPSLDPVKGRFKFIGTILHWDSLLMKKIRLYNGEIYRACDENFENLLWAEYWTKERLMDRYKSIGSVSFSSEYLNNPIENTSGLIKKEWIEQCYDETKSYNDYNEGICYLGVDFAFGDRVTNDNTVFLGLAPVQHKSELAGSEEKYLINRLDWRKGMSIPEQFENIQYLHKKNKYQDCVLEENSIKGMSKELFRYKFPYYLIWTGSNDPSEKQKQELEFKDKRHTVSKKNMIIRLSTLFENKKFLLPYKTAEDKEKSHKLKEELMTFSLNDGKLVEMGIHADAPIALSMITERINNKEDFGYAF